MGALPQQLHLLDEVFEYLQTRHKARACIDMLDHATPSVQGSIYMRQHMCDLRVSAEKIDAAGQALQVSTHAATFWASRRFHTRNIHIHVSIADVVLSLHSSNICMHEYIHVAPER